MLRPIYTIRFVPLDFCSGICDRVNTRKKRQISNFTISKREESDISARFIRQSRIVFDKSHRVDRPLHNIFREDK